MSLFKNPFGEITEADIEERLKAWVLEGKIKYTINEDGEYVWYNPKYAPKEALGAKEMAKQIKSELK